MQCVCVCVCAGLEGAAFGSRMPANRMTQQEIEFFPDIAHGSQPALMEFLLIRNRLLQAWLADPTAQLTTEKAQTLVLLPQSGVCVCHYMYECVCVCM